MATENIFLGPLSERLMSALALEEGAKLLSMSRGIGGDEEGGEGEEGNVEEVEEEEVDAEGELDEGDGERGIGGNARGGIEAKVEMDAVDLEERIKRELRFIGLLPEEEVSSPLISHRRNNCG